MCPFGTGEPRNLSIWIRKKSTNPAFVRQKNIVTHWWHFCRHVPHDSTLLIVYLMCEIKLAPHKDGHWCHRAAELQSLAASCVSNPKPGFVGGREGWTEPPGFRGMEKAFVLHETMAQSLMVFKLYGKTAATGNFLYKKHRRVIDFTPPFEIAIIIFPPLCHIFCKPRNTSATFKGWESILFFCRWQRLVSTMKRSVLLVFPFVLLLVGAQVPHWGPCPEPDVQPAFGLKEVPALCECGGHHSKIKTLPNYTGDERKATTCTKN